MCQQDTKAAKSCTNRCPNRCQLLHSCTKSYWKKACNSM